MNKIVWTVSGILCAVAVAGKTIDMLSANTNEAAKKASVGVATTKTTQFVFTSQISEETNQTQLPVSTSELSNERVIQLLDNTAMTAQAIELPIESLR